MRIIYGGRQVVIDDNLLERYRHVTGMDVDESYIPYWASNEGVSCEQMSSGELEEMVRRGMETELAVAGAV